MPLKAIFNGYFRSGTTYIWYTLKKFNPDKLVFYEPLNPNLFIYIQNEKGEKNSLHGKYLWKEYLQMDNAFLQKLRINHPNLQHRTEIPRNYKILLDYLEVFNSINRDVILQTNRLHFYYKIIAEKYNIPIFHIIRDPIEVYLSLINTRYHNFPFFNKIIYNTNPFNIKDIAVYIYMYYGIPYYLNANRIKEFFYFHNRKKMFLVTWIICNYEAIKFLEDINSLETLINYNKMLYDKSFINCLEKYNIKFEILSFRKKYIESKLYKSLQRDFEKLAQELDLKEKYFYILDKCF